MPTLSVFYGIVIFMHWNDHPPPHFHAVYGEYEATFTIYPIALDRGSLPARARTHVFEWAAHYQQELEEAWERSRRHEDPGRIDPLV